MRPRAGVAMATKGAAVGAFPVRALAWKSRGRGRRMGKGQAAYGALQSQGVEPGLAAGTGAAMGHARAWDSKGNMWCQATPAWGSNSPLGPRHGLDGVQQAELGGEAPVPGELRPR